MSPTEFDLRQALSDGEGDGVDAELIIFHARERRARRRQVLLSAAAAVVVVGGIAGGVAALTVNSSGNGSAGPSGAGSGMNAAGSAAAPNAAASRRGVTGSDLDGSAPAHQPANGTFACATRAPGSGLPNSGTTAQPGTTAGLLAGPVSEYRVCVLPFAFGTVANTEANTPKSGKPQRITVSGAAAAALTASIDKASPTPVHYACPMIRMAESVTITMVPVTPSGNALTPLVVSTALPACNVAISNGRAVRYNWQLPPQLERALHVTVVAGPGAEMPTDLVPGGSGAASGSPVH